MRAEAEMKRKIVRAGHFGNATRKRSTREAWPLLHRSIDSGRLTENAYNFVAPMFSLTLHHGAMRPGMRKLDVTDDRSAL